MAQIFINCLSGKDLLALPDGRHKDGLGLALIVVNGTQRSWTVTGRDANGKQFARGLGSLKDVTLEQARLRRDLIRGQAALVQADEPVRAAPRIAAKMPTFLERALEVIPVQVEGARDEAKARTKYYWERSLLRYAQGLHHLPINEITTQDVTCVLAPIWTTKAVTAREVRNHIGKVFGSAMADQLIDRNPAALKDNLEHKLSKQRHETRHHAMMPYAEVPAYFCSLEGRNELGALALQLTILTCVRMMEAATARHEDIKDGVWTVSTKTGLLAKVPLCKKALAIIDRAKQIAAQNPNRGDPAFVFPGRENGHLSHGTMLKVLKASHPELTVHGFRAAFRTWGAEVGRALGIDKDILEYCLHHIEGSATVRSYNRAECLDDRRVALEQWAAYLTARPAPQLTLVA